MGKKINTIIIGAGPAGMMAAGIAKENGNKVLVLEKMSKPCLKLGITGKGRCNLTNMSEIKDILGKFNSGKRFMKYSIHEFSNQNLIEFFESKGLKTKVERGNRVFPISDKAMEVVGIMKDWIRDLGVKIQKDVKILDILEKDGKITAVIYKYQDEIINQPCENLIIATGGKSYPKTGSTGDGYKLAEELGHTIIPPKPALVPLITEYKIHQLDKLKLKNINATFWADGRKLCEEFGELYFTEYGIDGPVVITMSNDVINALSKDQNVELSIDLKPALTTKQIKNRLLREIADLKSLVIFHLLRRILPEKLAEYCIDELQIDRKTKCAELHADDRKKIENWLKNFRVKVIGSRPIEEAIVTAGGINLKEVNPNTMESRITKNLYFAGEILDIDAKTGGYNLQAAFSTGYVAGKNVS